LEIKLGSGEEMSKGILPVKYDYVFKKIFGDVNNTDILAGFLKSVLDIPESEYDYLVISDPNLFANTQDEKLCILDVKVFTTNKKIIDVEIQVEPEAAFRERIVTYLSRMISSQTVKGADYTVIEKVISIVIADYILISENDEYHNRFHLYDPRTKTEFTDIIEINTLELKKLPKKDDLSDLWDWMKFVNAKEEKDMAELETIAETNPQIRKAVGVLKEMSRDEAEREIAESQERKRASINGQLLYATNKGKAESTLAIARRMKTKNIPLDTIMEVTELTAEEIESL
jgi:predicted transposase/invertase (TIGR01784 family)